MVLSQFCGKVAIVAVRAVRRMVRPRIAVGTTATAARRVIAPKLVASAGAVCRAAGPVGLLAALPGSGMTPTAPASSSASSMTTGGAGVPTGSSTGAPSPGGLFGDGVGFTPMLSQAALGNPGQAFAMAPMAFGDAFPATVPAFADMIPEIALPTAPLARDLPAPAPGQSLLPPDALLLPGPPTMLTEVPIPEALVPTAVPEPSSLSLLPIALAALVAFNRHRPRGAGRC